MGFFSANKFTTSNGTTDIFGDIIKTLPTIIDSIDRPKRQQTVQPTVVVQQPQMNEVTTSKFNLTPQIKNLLIFVLLLLLLIFGVVKLAQKNKK